MKHVKLTLKWNGPIFIGSLPEDEKTLGEMEKPGVYVYTQEYPEILAAYVGNSKNVLSRIQQHYGGFLGYTYWLRDEMGEWKFRPDKGFESLNRIDKTYRVAREEAKRLRFYYSILEDQGGSLIKPVESLLLRVLKDKDKTSIGKKTFVCDNERREGYHKDYPKVTFKNVFSKKQSVLRSLFGRDSFSWRSAS